MTAMTEAGSAAIEIDWRERSGMRRTLPPGGGGPPTRGAGAPLELVLQRPRRREPGRRAAGPLPARVPVRHPPARGRVQAQELEQQHTVELGVDVELGRAEPPVGALPGGLAHREP